MDTPDRAADLPEPLAAHLDASAEATATWNALSQQERHALAQWIHQAWFERGEEARADELFAAMTAGRDALAAWTSAEQQLPAARRILRL
jgi:uncharacterized protein YdeI (YjbR/CyaY-like superfamily)